MRVLLAPMDGVIDHTMRALLCQAGSIDRCVTEFVRVTNRLLPDKVFYRYCPELAYGGHTRCGVPVYIQLLGSNPQALAENARLAVQLGAPGIDLNFGCPAKTVNRHDGGSVLLQTPGRVFDIVQAVRELVPGKIPVTVKIRLGFNDSSQLHENVRAIVDAGADELAIHARTRADGYKPPAHWLQIAQISADCPIPVVANGEIWTTDDYRRCVEQSGCRDVMLGRGVLACPNLSKQLKAKQGGEALAALAWPEVCRLVENAFFSTLDQYDTRHVGGRVKQWLVYLKRQYPEAIELFETIKRYRDPELYQQAFSQSIARASGF